MTLDTKQKLEQLHKRMIEEVQDYAIILLDEYGTILTWNKGVEMIKGYKAHEIIGQNSIFFIFHRIDRMDCHKDLSTWRGKSQAYRPKSPERWCHILGKYSDHCAA